LKKRLEEEHLEDAVSGKPIVVGYDGSDGGEAALEWALGAAPGRGTSVRIVQAWRTFIEPWPAFGGYADPDPALLITAAEQTLAAALAGALRRAPQVPVDTKLVNGGAAAALIAESSQAEIIVVGSRGLGGFGELLLGSTAVELAAHAHCPVVVIRPETSEVAPGPQAGRVIVGVDGSAPSFDALAFAFTEASLRDLGLTAIHAWHSPYSHTRGEGAAPAGSVVDTIFQGPELGSLRDALATWRHKFPTVDVREAVIQDNPAAALVTASAGAELLVVGSRGRGGFASLLLGSVSHAVLHHAHCPVAVVRPTDTEPHLSTAGDGPD
jgi:nucleotide-binding universal stress UspA family protein